MRRGNAGWPVAVAWLTVLIGPPVAAGAVWQRFAAHHLELAVAVGAAYWAAVTVTGFAGGAAGDLAGRWRKRLVDRLDLAAQRRFTRFDGRYREFVLASLRFVDLKGLVTVGSFTPELDAVFVDVSLVPRPPHEIMPGVPGGPAPDCGRRSLEDFIGLPVPVVLAVVGAPGSGKTTLLRHIARRACLREHGRRTITRDLPALLYLRDHAAAITADPAVTLATLLRSALGDLAAAEPAEWLEQKLRDGRCTVLLDGLDEVARPEDRVRVAAWVERQTWSYPGNDFLVTSRPQGYRDAPVEGAEVVQVCSFTSAQVERFVRGWYRAAERESTGACAEERADDLLRRLDQAPALYELAVNPLLLTMITSVHLHRGDLPGTRAGLYAEICQVMLWRRQEAKSLTSAINGEMKETALRALACAMMQRRVSDLSRQDVLSEIRPVLQRLPGKLIPEDLLADTWSSGLLIERETEQYSFAHHTFQEYLAAAHILDNSLVSILAGGVSDPWWREATLLYAARASAGPIVEACLAAATVPALALAFDCADQDNKLDIGLRGRLDDLLASVSDPGTGSERRRLITSVLLVRHLRPQVRAADGTRVCTRPVSAGLYRLFTADTLTPSPDTTPDDAGTGTAAGMRGKDAVAFAHWANAATDGEVAYRLPGTAALDDPAVQKTVSTALPHTPNASVWAMQDSEDPDASPVLWTAPGAPSPRQVSAATLIACLEADVAQSTPTQIKLLTLQSLAGVGFRMNGLRVARDLTRDRDPAGARVRTSDLTRALDRASREELAFNRELDLLVGLEHGRDGEPSMVGDIITARDSDLAYARALARAPVLDVDDARALNDALNDALENARNDARGRASALASGYADLDNARGRTKDLDRVLALDIAFALSLDFARDLDDRSYDSSAAPSLGWLLSQALARARGAGATPGTWAVTFSRALAVHAEISGRSYFPEPDTLKDKLIQAVDVLREALPRRDDTGMPAWAVTVAERLVDRADPVLGRRERPAPQIVTGIRLAALCLAGEADALDRVELGDVFRQVAAGITLLELRYTGQRPATEIIMLATD